MEEKVKKQKFLQLQFCMLLLLCTLLPDLGSIIGIPDFDIPVFCCKLVGIIGGAMALYSFHKEAGPVPTPFLAIAGGGASVERDNRYRDAFGFHRDRIRCDGWLESLLL